MRPLFTIHAGEYLVGERLEGNKRKPNVWVPTKDKGIDLPIVNEIKKLLDDEVTAVEAVLALMKRPIK